MKRKKIEALILALACAGSMCLPVQAAKPSGGGDYVSGMEDVQESVASGETDTESAVNDQTDDAIEIGLEGGTLTIPAVDLSVLEQFYESMLNGEFS